MNAPMSQADERALVLWGGHRAQKKRCEGCGEQEASLAGIKKFDAERATLFAVEKALRAEIEGSVQALGAVLVIQINDEGSEEVTGLNRAALVAIRPQLVGAVAEDADRVLAQGKEEART